MNKLFQNALKRIPQDMPPIWFMRQAGRYHSHYQNMRAKYSFVQLCKQPELAAEVALGPILDFDFDVSILFSDILFPLEAFGMGLDYSEHGPQLGFKLDSSTITKLKTVDEAVEFMQFQKQAMLATRSLLPNNKSLIGFVGAPWTLFVYALEGSHTGSLIQSKTQISLFPIFLEKILALLKANIRLQLESGAEVVMLFDTAAGEVSPAFFQQWLQPGLENLCREFPGKLGYYSKGSQDSFFDQNFCELPWAGQGFDHRWEIKTCFNLHKNGFIQGNFDQSLLFMNADEFKRELKNFLRPLLEMTPSQRAGWVCGLGHGVLPKTPEANVKIFVEIVREEFNR